MSKNTEKTDASVGLSHTDLEQNGKSNHDHTGDEVKEHLVVTDPEKKPSRRLKDAAYPVRRERLFNIVITLSVVTVLVVIGLLFLILVVHSLPSIEAYGFSFIVDKVWNPVTDKFGALPFLIGTLLTSFVALLISIPFSLAISVFLGEYARENRWGGVLRNMIELLAGVPSVIYGFWGLMVLVPIVRSLAMTLNEPPYGVGVLAASLILAVMIVPYSASISREVISLVPDNLKEAAYALGATRYEVVRHVIIPQSFSGIFAGVLLSFGRALGETMAVTMVIGNTNAIPNSLFSTGNTMASVIANEFTEATGTLHLASLIEIGLLLFIVTLIINSVGRYIIKKFSISV